MAASAAAAGAAAAPQALHLAQCATPAAACWSRRLPAKPAVSPNRAARSKAAPTCCKVQIDCLLQVEAGGLKGRQRGALVSTRDGHKVGHRLRGVRHWRWGAGAAGAIGWPAGRRWRVERRRRAGRRRNCRPGWRPVAPSDRSRDAAWRSPGAPRAAWGRGCEQAAPGDDCEQPVASDPVPRDLATCEVPVRSVAMPAGAGRPL